PLRRYCDAGGRSDRVLWRPLFRSRLQLRGLAWLHHPCRGCGDRRSCRRWGAPATTPPGERTRARARMTTVARAAFIATLILALTGCGGADNANRSAGPTTRSATSSRGSAPGPRQLVDLHDLEQLRSLFNARAGEPR